MSELNERIREVLIEEEMKQSYLTYALSTLTARAIPDVRDGLKPSQRRTLVAMNDLNLGPRSKYRKCAKIVGDTSGNYHPHGDQNIYPTLVRMAQSFSLRYPLVDGQGNFGSIDGDPPAAQRYTEARMTSATMVMLEDIEKDTVDYIPNYENTRTEPTVLPAKFPNLLVNGSTGIAVGMATSIPPHNLGEVTGALIHMTEHPDMTVNDAMKYITGPDFPTGGLICGREGIRRAYRTGLGRVTVRAQAAIEQNKGGKANIVVTEIPYQLNKTSIIERIVACVKAGSITGISDVRDESDREGMRLVIELRRGEEPEVVLNQLFKHTSLQTTFSINLIALRAGRPEALTLLEIMRSFLDHRLEVIRRRTRYLLDKAEARLHIVEGLLKALDHIDAIIALIRASKTRDEAKTGLMTTFGFSERQAEAILTMQLQRLVGLEREKLEAEAQELRENIKYYKALLADEKLVYDVIREDLEELRDKFRDGRRTQIVDSVEDLSVEDLIADEEVVVTISHEGYIKRTSLGAYRKQGRGGQGVIGGDHREGDFTEHLFVAATHDYMLFFTSLGRCHWLKVYDVPQLSRQSRGRALVNMLQLDTGESIAAMIPVRTFDDRFVIMATRNGVVKKTPLEAYSRPLKCGVIAIKIDEGDELIGARISSGRDEVMLCTAAGKSIRFKEGEARPMGRNTRGVAGIRLGKGDAVVDMLLVEKDGTALVVCENGFGKRTPFDEYRLQKRGGSGVINIRTTDRNGKVVAVKAVRDGDELMMITYQGKIIRFAIKDLRSIGRATQGVRVIRMQEGDTLVAVAPVRESEESDETAEQHEADTPETQ